MENFTLVPCEVAGYSNISSWLRLTWLRLAGGLGFCELLRETHHEHKV